MKTGRWDLKFGAGGGVDRHAGMMEDCGTPLKVERTPHTNRTPMFPTSAGINSGPPAPIDPLSVVKNIPTMTEQLITEKKQIALTQCAELYAGQNLRLQREALKAIEETAGRFVEILDEELNDKAD